jgi:hypothetical protein
VVYSPGSNYNPSQTGTSPSPADLTETVLPATKVTLASSAARSGGASYSLLNNTVTFTATVAPVAGMSNVEDGAVTFYDGTTALGTVNLDGNNKGVVTFASSSLGSGSHNISAVYGGATDFAGSSGGLTQVVQALDHLTATMSPASPSLGAAFTVTVTACDSSGNPVLALTSPGELDLVSAPSGGSVTGPDLISVSNGRVTFVKLSATARGAYRLRASVGGLSIDITFSV